jgi:UTP---glucose-1-phosphate uridylyltransferase
MGMTLSAKIEILKPLAENLSRMESSEEKIEYLASQPETEKFLEENLRIKELIQSFGPDSQASLLALIALGEADVLFSSFSFDSEEVEALRDLAKRLIYVEDFYNDIGGVVGYCLAFLRLLQNNDEHGGKQVRYDNPDTFDLSDKNDKVKDVVLHGLENLPRIAAIFPVGGAGDRLDLHDEATGQPLPAAKLEFLGSTLLEQMIGDIQALEYLHYKLFARQIMVPVALMTSFEKENHSYIRKICADNKWFYRDPESIFTVVQPLVPVITEEGRLSFSSPLELNWKPGGHGVIWKLAIDKGVVDHLLGRGIEKAFLRQVNNPLAGLDNNLLGLIGRGFENGMNFGVIASERPLKASEGMIVLKKDKSGYSLANIEYTEFVKEGLEDKPQKEGGRFSVYPGNTNILLADLNAVKEVIRKNPLPGMMINLKTKFTSIDASGKKRQTRGGRLETLMQNISNEMVYPEREAMASFTVFNHRQKVISSTKRTYEPGNPVDDTPESAFYNLLANHHDLLKNYCRFQIPEMPSMDDYLASGPSFVLTYHPSLGPLYEIVAQKLTGGGMTWGSHLRVDVAELDADNLFLDGSLQILSDFPMGHLDENNLMRYSERGPKCELINCTVENKGIDRSSVEAWWKNRYRFHETCEIKIEGNGEFFAEGVAFEGPFSIFVPSGHRVTASVVDGGIVFDTRLIDDPTWYWVYSVAHEIDIKLTKKEFAVRKGL